MSEPNINNLINLINTMHGLEHIMDSLVNNVNEIHEQGVKNGNIDAEMSTLFNEITQKHKATKKKEQELKDYVKNNFNL